MKGLPTIKQVLGRAECRTPTYEWVKTGKDKFSLCEVQSGQEVNILFELHINPKRGLGSEHMFHSMYQQLKGIFENVSRHH